MILSVVVVYEDAQDQLLWLREPVVLNIAIHQGVVVCATGGSHTDWHISVLR